MKFLKNITSKEIKSRKDFSGVTLFNHCIRRIAKDFDDAISYRNWENGNLEVGGSYPDVTHYVRLNTPFRKEAYKSSNLHLFCRSDYSDASRAD